MIGWDLIMLKFVFYLGWEIDLIYFCENLVGFIFVEIVIRIFIFIREYKVFRVFKIIVKDLFCNISFLWVKFEISINFKFFFVLFLRINMKWV